MTLDCYLNFFEEMTYLSLVLDDVENHLREAGHTTLAADLNQFCCDAAMELADAAQTKGAFIRGQDEMLPGERTAALFGAYRPVTWERCQVLRDAAVKLRDSDLEYQLQALIKRIPPAPDVVVPAITKNLNND